MSIVPTAVESNSLEILIYPNPVLKRKSKPVKEVDDEIRLLARSLSMAMVNAPGVGLAAPQVGVLKRLIVIDQNCDNSDEDDETKPLAMINPELVEADGEMVGEEGCLSMPRLFADIPRAKQIKAEYTDTNGDKKEITATGYLARCIQHEIDHLDGILFWDHLNVFRRNMLKMKFTGSQTS